MRLIILPFFLWITFSLTAQNLYWANDRQIYDETKVYCDNEGNVFMTGNFVNTVDFDHGPDTFEMTAEPHILTFLLKQSPDGDFLWAKQMETVSGGVTFSEGLNINTDSDGNVYITGRYGGTVDFDMGPGVSTLTSQEFSDIFLAKYDNDGNYLWAFSIGGVGYDYGKDVVFSEGESAIYLTGTFKGPADFDPGPEEVILSGNGLNDVFIAKYDLDGNYIWALSVGGTDGDDPEAMAVDEQGNVAITGFFRDIVDFDPGPETYNLTAVLGLEIFTAMYDRDGNFLWANPVLVGGGDRGKSLGFDSNGNLFVVGVFRHTADFDPTEASDSIQSVDNSTDFFIMKYTNAGTYLWAQNIGGINGDLASEMLVDAYDNIHITGRVFGTVDFDPSDSTAIIVTPENGQSFFLASYDNDGVFRSIMALGEGDNKSQGFSLALDDFGNIYTSGRYYNDFDFDPSPDSLILESDEIHRSFLAKYSTSGCLNSYSSTAAVICSGETFVFNGQDLDSTDIYQYSIPNSNGCDSIITLDLTVLSEINTFVNAGICLGDSIIFEGEVITTEGEYVVTYPSSNNCDSLIILNLQIWETYDFQQESTFCFGDSIVFENQIISEAGIYTESYLTNNGCDSIITMTASVYDLPEVDLGSDIEITTLENYQFSLTENYPSILWSNGSTDIDLVFEGADYPPGEYTISVTVIDENGCIAYDEVNILLTLEVNVNEPVWAKEIAIFPNPADEIIQIHALGLENTKFAIKNNLGENVAQGVFDEKTIYDFSNEVPGIYFILIENNEQTVVRKVAIF